MNIIFAQADRAFLNAVDGQAPPSGDTITAATDAEPPCEHPETKCDGGVFSLMTADSVASKDVTQISIWSEIAQPDDDDTDAVIAALSQLPSFATQGPKLSQKKPKQQRKHIPALTENRSRKLLTSSRRASSRCQSWSFAAMPAMMPSGPSSTAGAPSTWWTLENNPRVRSLRIHQQTPRASQSPTGQRFRSTGQASFPSKQLGD